LTRFQYALAEKQLPLEEKVEILKRACEEAQELEIVYLKSSDEKSRRKILPLEVSEQEFRGKSFLALRAFCFLRKEERTFNVEKILEIRETNTTRDTKRVN
jgi:predicted DNA-binding transcriptional regulator YafY